MQYGLPGEEVGIITPLRHQQVLISDQLRMITMPPGHSHPGKLVNTASHCCSIVECNTVDKYQGRDKQCIIVSFVRSNAKGNVSVVLCTN